MNFWEKAFPLVGTLRGYQKDQLRGDITAGVTTAVMLIPQGMAYAMLAGLPPIVGLYSALVPPLLYAFLGTSRQLSVGPVAMDSLLVAAGVGAIAQTGTDEYVAAAVLLALMVGAIQLLMGILRMGFLVNFLSQPVISGFTSAAALIIGLSQFKHILGVSMKNSPNVFGLLAQIFEKAGEVQFETLLIGGVAIAMLVTMKKKAPKIPAALLAVSIGAVIVWAANLEGKVAIVGTVPAGLPDMRVPPLDWELMKTLLPSAITIALVAFMESIAVSQTYARKNNYTVRPSRELVALGFSNLAGSLFQGYPVTGGFSRTAVNAQAGAKTNLAALLTSVIIGVALLFLTPLFYFLPKAVLAAIIVTAVFGLIDLNEVVRLKKIKRSDLLLLAGTFAATLSLGIIQGIGLGVGASLLWFVVRTTRPHVAVLGRVPGTTHFRNVRRNRGLTTYQGVIAVRMDAQFYFGNVTFLKETLSSLEGEMPEPLQAVIMDASAINNLDSSAESALRELRDGYESRGVQFYLTGVKGPVFDVLESSGLAGAFGASCRCLSVHEAIHLLGAEPRDPIELTSDETEPGGVERAGSSAHL